jgi:hypothetical protein
MNVMQISRVVEINLTKLYFEPLDRGQYDFVDQLIEKIHSLVSNGYYVRLYKEITELSQMVWKNGRFDFETTVFEIPEKYFVKDIFGPKEFEEWKNNAIETLNYLKKVRD